MTSNVARLLPNNALCVNATDLADRLREMADRVEAGEFGEIERVIIMLDAPSIDYRCYGRPTSKSELVWLLEWAKVKAMGFLD